MDVLLCFGLFNKICLYNLTQPFLATLSRPVQQGDLYANVSMEVKMEGKIRDRNILVIANYFYSFFLSI